jgi:hypothetical protein
MNSAQSSAMDLVSNWGSSGGYALTINGYMGTGYTGLSYHVNGNYTTNEPRFAYSANKTESLSGQYINYGSSGCAIKLYASGISKDRRVSNSTCTSIISSSNIHAIGGYAYVDYLSGDLLKDTKIHSVRIYQRALSESEVLQNTTADSIRFQSVPTVTIGGKACTNVAVISDTQLKCNAPSGTAGSNVAVTVKDSGGTQKTIPGGYNYVSTTSFYVTDITPSVGPTFGGTPLTLTGSSLNTITGVTVGGQDCTEREEATNTATSYTCTIPAMDTDGHKNVVVTVTGGTSYTFANAFKYVLATRDPMKGNVQ